MVSSQSTDGSQLPVTVPRPPIAADDAVGRAVQAGFGLLALAAELLARGAAGQTSPVVHGRSSVQTGSLAPEVTEALDVLLGAAWGVARAAGSASTSVTRTVAPLVRIAFDPPLVPTALRPATLLRRSTDRWREDRPETIRTLTSWSSSLVPDVVELALGMVDLDAVVAMVLDRIDVDAAVRHALDEVDLEARIDQVLASITLEQVVQQSLGELDLTALVDQAMSEIDLTATVLEHLNLQEVIDAALDSIDLNTVIREQVNVPALAEYVVEVIDLPELVRESTGSIASESVRGVRVQGIDADQAISRVVDRLLRRAARPTPVDPAAIRDQGTKEPRD